MIDFSTFDFDAFVAALPSDCRRYYRIEGHMNRIDNGVERLMCRFVHPNAWIVSFGRDGFGASSVRIYSGHGYYDVPLGSIDSIVILSCP